MSKPRGIQRKTAEAMPIIRHLHGQGVKAYRIAEATGLSANTVARETEIIDASGKHSTDMSLVPRCGYGCVDMGGLNPVDGFWCSACGFAVTVSRHELDEAAPDWDVDCECVPRYCPICGKRIDWKGAA